MSDEFVEQCLEDCLTKFKEVTYVDDQGRSWLLTYFRDNFFRELNKSGSAGSLRIWRQYRNWLLEQTEIMANSAKNFATQNGRPSPNEADLEKAVKVVQDACKGELAPLGGWCSSKQ